MAVQEHRLPRHEWKAFRDQIQSGEPLLRVPTFGDFATQHGEYIETSGPVSVSASIRYTASETFVVEKGQLLKVGAGYLQYPANAQLLCACDEFRTITSCAGDDYIQDKANKMQEIEQKGKGTGDPTTWLQASLNRHWSVTTTQLSTLFAP